MNLKLIAESADPTAGEPLTVEQVTSQLRYGGDDQDDLISAYISAARGLAEFYNGRKFVLSQWALGLDCWPGSANWLAGVSSMADPYWGNWQSDAYRFLSSHPWGLNAIALLTPLVSVDSVIYRDSTGAFTTLVEGTDYIVDTFKSPGIIAPMPNGQWPLVSLWPSSAIIVTFQAGMVPDAAAYTAANPSAPVVPQVGKHIRQGMMLLCSQFFIARVPYDALRFITEPPFSVNALFTSDKLWK
jgi:hypothetical protein